jgi:cephalosporin-C deacetylase-like acetyl esterase
MLDLNGLEAVPALFVRPRALTGRAPAVIYNHAHGGQYKLGKQELLDGRKELASPPYAEFLTSLGMSVLAIDAWVFGERATRSEADTFKEMLWRGRVLWGMMVFDSLRALDYLVTRPEVEAQRIATVGLSMGSAMAQWLAALDERVKACVDLCCLTDYQALIEAGNIGVHSFYYFVPGLLRHFTAAEINALTAPRAHLSLDGNLDRITPAAGLDRIDAALRTVYASLGHAERWQLRRYEGGHQETDEMRGEVRQFLLRFL